MPLYEYQCKKCHHRFERIQKFSDPHVKKCPDCGGPVEQMISAPAVQFKGSGFYVTDYPKQSAGASRLILERRFCLQRGAWLQEGRKIQVGEFSEVREFVQAGKRWQEKRKEITHRKRRVVTLTTKDTKDH